jgi:hypothetical protein
MYVDQVYQNYTAKQIETQGIFGGKNKNGNLSIELPFLRNWAGLKETNRLDARLQRVDET